MERDRAVEPHTQGACVWRIEDETEPTSPRFALGTREIVPLVLSEPVHRDLSHEEVAHIVHDLKGPIATIDLEVELLRESGVGSPIIERIMRNVAFLDRMVMDLLDRCTLDAGRFELHRAPIELLASIESVIDRVVPTRDRGRVILQALERVSVDVDDLRIERVIANLLHNALRYAPVGTDIVIKLEREPTLVRVSVVDAGRGLTALDLANVFAEYRPRSPTSSRKGTGIGLSLCKQIVEAHGGTIGVDTSGSEGTRFFFELPAAS
jgi:signal transduction histidine kinase